jgi:putative transposase
MVWLPKIPNVLPSMMFERSLDTLRFVISVLVSLVLTARSCLRSRVALHLEVLALRHELQVLNRSRPRRWQLVTADRWLWAWLSRSWTCWSTALVIVKPETVVAWHRKGFRVFWTWKSRRRVGRPAVAADVRALIRSISAANPLWGAPRIHGELLKLGLDVSQATVAKYMRRRITPPSQTWRTFLTNHAQQIAAADFFVVPTATGRLLFVLRILAHERRRVVHIAVTDHPTAAWTAQQLREAFPWDEAPRYLVHDRDTAVHAWAAPALGIDEVITAVRSPWQNAYAERLIGSICRECLDHIIIGNERGLRRVLPAYVEYYLKSRTHLSLSKDAPVSRLVASPSDGEVMAIPQVGGLHHRYERRAA